jgi:hypothetical protein
MDRRSLCKLVERELQALVARGMTIAELALELRRSKTAVRYWLTKYGLRTMAAQREQAASEGIRAGLLETLRTCSQHGETTFVIESSGYYRCKRCRQERVAGRRRDVKAILVSEAGGRCRICGYDRCVAALEFHHLDRTSKRLGVSAGGLSRSIAALRAEVSKCVSPLLQLPRGS